jgi:hypothetical protein
MGNAMRVGGVAATVVWSVAAFTVLLILAIALSGTWLHVAFGCAAAADLAVAAVTLRVLSKVSTTSGAPSPRRSTP